MRVQGGGAGGPGGERKFMEAAHESPELTAGATEARDEPRDEPREPAGAARSQNVVYTIAHDWGAIPQFLAPALERVDRTADGTQLLVLTADAETAHAVADVALGLRDDAGGRPLLVPVTGAARAMRLARAGAPAAVAGAPEALAALVRGAALKLDSVRAVILAWADDMTGPDASAALEAVLAEVPKDATRVLVTARQTDAVEALIERYLRRPRRVTPAVQQPGGAVAMTYLAVAPAARSAALRRLLDEMDPPSAAVLVMSEASEREAARTLRSLGYHAGAISSAAAAPDAGSFGPDVRVVRGDAPHAAPAGVGSAPTDSVGAPDGAPPTAPGVSANVALLVLYDLPTDRAALDRAVAARPAQIVALAQPRQLDALRQIAGGPVTPLALPDQARDARTRDDAMRAELRAALTGGVPHRELLALEPLLAEFDGVQLAAAALRLLEQTRELARARGVQALTPAAPPARGGSGGGGHDAASGMTRLFITVGSKDGVRPGDLVGAIANSAGISSERLGRVEIRDAFSLVEVASGDAARVIEKVNGIAIRGRRAVVREERDAGGGGGPRERRGGAERGGGSDRRGPERGAGARPGGMKDTRSGPRDAGRSDRGAREDRGGPRGERGPRAFDARRDGPRGPGRDDRGVRERAEQRGEWADRAARLRNARRGAPGSRDVDDSAESTGGNDRNDAPRRVSSDTEE